MSDLDSAIRAIEASAKALRLLGPELESKTIRQRVALSSIVDLVDGCELNGDSNRGLRNSVVDILASIKAVAEAALKKGPTQ